MGWSFLSSCPNKAAIIKHLTAPESGLTTHAKCVKGNVLWTVQESLERPGKKFIGCYLLGADQGWWGYKDMDESCGPCNYNCPLSYLEMVADPGGYATAWREKVRAFHHQLAKFNGMKVGTKVKLKDGLTIQGQPITEAIIESVRPLRANVLAAGSTYPRTVRLSKRYIEAVIQ